MLNIVILLGILFGIAYGKPLSSCSSQIGCMELGVTEQSDLDSDGNKQYEICIYFNPDRDECSKEGDISHACSSTDEEDKIEGWGSGEDNKLCNIVSCGRTTFFGVKDGPSCNDGSIYGNMAIDGYDRYIYCYSSNDDSLSAGSCGSNPKKKTKNCRYIIPAPDCDNDDTTTAAPDATTTSAPKTTVSDSTTSAPDTTASPRRTTTSKPDEPTEASCDCSMAYVGEGFADECIMKCGEGNCMPTCNIGCMEDAECLPSSPADPYASNVYIRDQKGDNSNLNFVIDTDTDTDTTNSNDTDNNDAANNNYHILFVAVAMFVHLF